MILIYAKTPQASRRQIKGVSSLNKYLNGSTSLEAVVVLAPLS